MTQNVKTEQLLEEIAAFSSLESLQEQCLRAYEIDKKITGHLKLEEVAEKIAAKRPVGSSSETNTLKRRLQSAKKALAPYKNLQESNIIMEQLERKGVSNPNMQRQVLNSLKANLPKRKDNAIFNDALEVFQRKIDRRIEFISSLQEYHQKFNTNLKKILATADPANRAEHLNYFEKHFLKTCRTNINTQGFEAEFDIQHKLWAYQFEQIQHFNRLPPFNDYIPKFKELNKAWKNYLITSPLALEQKAKQLAIIQEVLEQNVQLTKDKIQIFESLGFAKSAKEKHSKPIKGIPESTAELTLDDMEPPVEYELAKDAMQREAEHMILNAFQGTLGILKNLQDQVDVKMQEILFSLDIDRHYHQSPLSTTTPSALQHTVNVVHRMQKSDLGESLNIPGQLKHIAEEARLEAIDTLHRGFTVPGPDNGLVQNWKKAASEHPNATPPFFTWLQIAPAYQDLEWEYGPNNGKIFVESSRLSGVGVAGVHLDRGRIKYLNSVEREERLLKVEDGVLKDSTNNLADTQGKRTQNFGGGTGTFVVSPSGKLYIGEHIVGKEYHSSLLAGGSARCAGMIKIDNGVIDWITNKTGHYRTGNAELVAELIHLRNQGLDLSNTKVRFIVLIGNSMRHEDYSAAELLAALTHVNNNNLDLTSKAGIQFMEPFLIDAASSLGLTRASTSTYEPILVTPVSSSFNPTTPNNQTLIDDSDYEMDANNTDSDEEGPLQTVEIGYDAELDHEQDETQEEEQVETLEMGYDVDIDHDQEAHRAPSIRFSFSNHDRHVSRSQTDVNEADETPVEDEESKSLPKHK